MRQISTRLRVTLISAVFLTLLTLTLVGLWLSLQSRYLRAEQIRKASLAVNLMVEFSKLPLGNAEYPLQLSEMADRAVLSDEISRVMITDRLGEVYADSAHNAYETKPAIIKLAFRRRNIIINTYPGYLRGASAVTNESGQIVGGVIIDFPTQVIYAARRNTQIIGALIALLGIALGSALSYLAAQFITSPLERLLQGIRQLQIGEAGEPVPTTGGPELAEIGRAFNEMSGAVRERVRKLELLNQMAADLSAAGNISDAASIIDRSSHLMIEASSYLWIVDQFSRMLIPVPMTDKYTPSEPVLATDEFVVGKAFIGRRVLVAGEGARALPAELIIAPGLKTKSAVALPLVTQDGIAGVLALTDPGRRRYISAEDEALARAIGTIAAPIIMAKLRAETQARAAATLQSLLVPIEKPDIGIDFYVTYMPAEEIAGLGGDYYDFIPLGDSRWAVIVGDASGKGLEAARHIATAKFIIRSYILEYGNPAESLDWSNRALIAQEEPGKFITLFCGILDVTGGVLTHTNAGHVPPLVYRKDTGQVETITVHGTALGIAPDVTFEDSTIFLKSGDIFCAYTDGISEARRGNEWFGDERVAELIKANSSKSAEEICDSIMREVKSFIGGASKDDIVLMLFKIP